VVWALATLYGSALGEHLVFKGGTSLSKAYQVRDQLESVKVRFQEAAKPISKVDIGFSAVEVRSPG
jgi:predicted nucleotidyltransferase component of viral defense system